MRWSLFLQTLSLLHHFLGLYYRLQEDIVHLAEGERHGAYSPERHTETAAHVLKVFESIGFATRRHSFMIDGREGVNVVGRKEGSDRSLRPLLLSAHYDTVPGSPGADDNASGVAALLECARVLSTMNLQRPVEFVAFDIEEVQPEGAALVGSSEFVNSLDPKASYEGLYNLEMVGYSAGPGTQGYPPGFQLLFPGAFRWVQERDFRGDFIAVVAQGGGVDMGRRIKSASEGLVGGLEVLLIEVVTGMPIPPDVFRGDHAPFWAAGIPAVMITGTADFRNSNYHQPTDTPDTIDCSFVAGVTQTMVATLATHAGISDH